MPSDYRPTGLLVPIVTPFGVDGAVDARALERLGAELLEAGASGLVALGTTGEPTSLDPAEQALVVATLARVTAEHGADLIVGAGTNDTRTTIANHQALADVPGVSASLAMTPYYVRPSEEGIVEHFRAVAAASPVPVLAYNVPYRTGRGLGARALLELAAIPNVAGLKQAVGALDADTLELLAEAPDGFSVLGGDDAFLFPTMLMGGTGAIAASGHLATERFAAMLAAGAEDDVAAGRPHAEALLPLVGALFAEPSPAVLKALLHEQGRIPAPDVRLPHLNATPEGVERGRAALAGALAGTASAAG
jgi:4-hydroxy-tetrahydrodipicolinate synthase